MLNAIIYLINVQHRLWGSRATHPLAWGLEFSSSLRVLSLNSLLMAQRAAAIWPKSLVLLETETQRLGSTYEAWQTIFASLNFPVANHFCQAQHCDCGGFGIFGVIVALLCLTLFLHPKSRTQRLSATKRKVNISARRSEHAVQHVPTQAWDVCSSWGNPFRQSLAPDGVRFGP